MLDFSFRRRQVPAVWLTFLSALVACLAGVPAVVQGQPVGSTRPPEGLLEKTPSEYALVGARLVLRPGEEIAEGTLLVDRGRITAVGPREAVEIPASARQLDLSGLTIYPGLIDSYSTVALDASHARRGAAHWNSYIRAQLSVADHFQADAAAMTARRKQGITAALVAPSGGIIKGTSAVVSTGTAANDFGMLNPAAAMHLRLTVSGGSRKSYPNSPMGAVALARQTLLDTQWHVNAEAAHRADPSLPRPERNDSLTALAPYLNGQGLVIVDTSNELFCLRADRFARAFQLRLALVGSGNEYRRLDEVAATGRTVIVPVDFPKPPNVATAEAARDVSLEALLHWDHAPENPARLSHAGIPLAFTTDGLDDIGKFLAGIRQAVSRGLPSEAALRALTTTPAELLGVDHLTGTLQRGKLANLVLADGDLFDKKTKIRETWVAGERFQWVSDPEMDLRGTWELQLSTRGISGDAVPRALALTLAGAAEKLTGTIARSDAPAKDTGAQPTGGKPAALRLIGTGQGRFSCAFDAADFGREGTAQLSAVVSADGKSWQGHVTWPDGVRQAQSATKQAKQAADEPPADDAADSKNGDNQEPPAGQQARPDEGAEQEAGEVAEASGKIGAGGKDPLAASFPVNYPLGAFGRTEPPAQPHAVVLRGATVWTCGPEGTLPQADVLIERGVIKRVAARIQPPAGAVVIDLTGKHLSPGIIDCHSHMATDGGVNESAQAVTAEVRIGDFIDCDDITIYRQLAGGVTSSNILHGSANPIGGQNQVIKLRWGAGDEAVKFAQAPAGIKFALGENVKQSNWGDDYTTRYPQTRMGVEQLIRDRFRAAQEYREQWAAWDRGHTGLPPRRDLELEALVEVLQQRRWVHCHSYRQDEILALIRTLDDYDVTIGTFQHILEGYKVADAMAKHGAMGSAFSDWWAYKFEVYDAIPYNGALMHQAGIVVSFNSDDRELGRHLNHEAAKAIKYGGVSPEEALKFVTLNPAKQLRIDAYVGSLEPGKHADLVVWNRSPLSTFSRCEQTWIDGRKYFDVQDDQQLRARAALMRRTLVQKILASGQPMRKPGEGRIDPASLWPREDEFCHHGTHGHGHGHAGHHDAAHE